MNHLKRLAEADTQFEQSKLSNSSKKRFQSSDKKIKLTLPDGFEKSATMLKKFASTVQYLKIVDEKEIKIKSIINLP